MMKLIIPFTDGFDGADFLHAQITVVPEPSLPVLGLAGALFAVGARR